MLHPKASNYLVALAIDDNTSIAQTAEGSIMVGLAYVDVSTGQMHVSSVSLDHIGSPILNDI